MLELLLRNLMLHQISEVTQPASLHINSLSAHTQNQHLNPAHGLGNERKKERKKEIPNIQPQHTHSFLPEPSLEVKWFIRMRKGPNPSYIHINNFISPWSEKKETETYNNNLPSSHHKPAVHTCLLQHTRESKQDKQQHLSPPCLPRLLPTYLPTHSPPPPPSPSSQFQLPVASVKRKSWPNSRSISSQPPPLFPGTTYFGMKRNRLIDDRWPMDSGLTWLTSKQTDR